MKCLLKIFGILTINEIVPYREHPNPKFAYVYYGKGWHTVPIEDIKYCNEILVQHCVNNSEYSTCYLRNAVLAYLQKHAITFPCKPA